MRGNIETGVSIIAPKMSDGVSAHVRSDPLVARPLKKKKKIKSDPILENATAFLLKTVYPPIYTETLAIQRNVIFIYQSWTEQKGEGMGSNRKREKKKRNETKEEKRGREEGEKNSCIFSGVKLFFY